MLLQIAIDIADTRRILEIADQVHDVVDIIEVGTPVVLKEGMAPVRELKKKYPELIVLADTKIADAGELECRDACENGADIITVLAFSDLGTIEAVAKTAHSYGRKIMADLLCIEDIPARARALSEIGVDYIAIHTGVDMQKQGRTPLKDLQTLVSVIDPAHAAVAGGVSLPTVDSYAALKPGIIIAGGALYNAPDIRQAAIDMKERLNKWE